MSHWPGGQFYGTNIIGGIPVTEGYYEFEPSGCLTSPKLRQSNPIPLAARTNPYTKGSHSSSIPGISLDLLARLKTVVHEEPNSGSSSTVTISTSVLDSWATSIREARRHLDALYDNRRNAERFEENEKRMSIWLADLRKAINDREKINRRSDRR